MGWPVAITLVAAFMAFPLSAWAVAWSLARVAREARLILEPEEDDL